MKTKKMTDLEKFIDTYKQFGINVVTGEYRGNILITLNPDGTDNPITESDKFDGYSGCSSDLEFTKEGEFIRQGFTEF